MDYIQDAFLIVGIFAFYVYVFYIYMRFGILKSVSASTYWLKGQQRWWFLAGTWIPAIAILAQGMDVFSFLGGAGLMFTGLTINHRVNIAGSRIIHGIGATVAIVSILVGILYLYGLWLPLVSWLILTSLLYFISNKWVWWSELYAVLVIAIGILIN